MSPRSSSRAGRRLRAKRCTISIDRPISRPVLAIRFRTSSGWTTAVLESAASWTLMPTRIWEISSCNWRLICFRSVSWAFKISCVSCRNCACSPRDSASKSRWACSLSLRDASLPPPGDLQICLLVRGGQRVHAPLGLLPPFQRGDIRDRQPAPIPFALGQSLGRGLKIGPEGRAGRSQQQRFTGLLSGPSKHGFQERVEGRPARRSRKTPQASLDIRDRAMPSMVAPVRFTS